MKSPTVRFRIDFGPQCSVGPGKIELLEGIQRSGSLSQAARDLDMSYRRAWLLLDSMNTGFQQPVASASVGGKGGGGAEITPFGESLIAAYRAFERDLGERAAHHLGKLGKQVGAPRAIKQAAPRGTSRRVLARRKSARASTPP